MIVLLTHLLYILLYVFIIVVGYCLDVLKTRLQDCESSARNRVSESPPNFTVSRAHLHDYANQAIPFFLRPLPVS